VPPRSNEFQRLVRTIYEQIVPEGATVTESAMVRERGSSVEREVDILVESRVGDIVVRLGVECRDRARRDDIEWVDQLIGKYRDLPVDKIIAVSSSGLTRAAQEKAAANRIEVRTLTEALDADWPKELVKTQIANLRIHVQPKKYAVFSDPEWPDTRQPVAARFGDRELTKTEFELLLAEVGEREIFRILENERDHPLRQLENLDNKDYDLELELAMAQPVTLVSALNTDHRLLHVTLKCKVNFQYCDLLVRRHLYGDIGVTIATDTTAEPAVRIVKVQEPGRAPRDASIPIEGDEE
jgi:hypothetical protein